MPRTQEQFNEIREIKRQLIMDSALEIFAQKGFSAASINMIAKKAKISKGLIYNYFNSKEELISSIIIDGFDKFINIFKTDKNKIIAKEDLELFVDKTLEVLETNINFWKLYFLVIMQPDVLQLVESKLLEIALPFFKTLESYYASKGIENPMSYARFVGATLDGICMNYVVDPENFPLNDIKNIIKSKIL